MVQSRLDEVGIALAALLAGDGTGHSSGGAITSSNLSTWQGRAPTGTSDMTYLGYLKGLYSFYPGKCTTIIGSSTEILEAMTIAKPTTDPLWFYTFLNQGMLKGTPILVNGRAPDSVRYVIHDDGAESDLVGIDKSAALLAYREAGADLTETDKVINGQWNEIVISNTIGFQTLFVSARKVLKTNGRASGRGDEPGRRRFLIARYAYPTLDVPAYRQQLDTMAQEIRERIGQRASGEETVNALNRYFFTEQGFKGNTKNYYEVENSYLNRVIDRRVGIPISLSVVYLLIGQRLGLPLHGIGMPGHFLVKYDSERYKIFIDCFNGGALLTDKNCARFLTEAGYGFDEKYLQKSPVRAILSARWPGQCIPTIE